MSELPEYMRYPGVWDIADEADPESVINYLAWILDEPDRAESAAQHLRWLSIGMHFLTIGNVADEHGATIDKVELNLWHEAYPPTEANVIGGHAHSRDMELQFLADPRARQTVTWIDLLAPKAPDFGLAQVQERQLAILHKVDHGDGFGPVYNPRLLGSRRVLETVIEIPPRARQYFSSLKIHEVAYQGPGTGVTVQRQGRHERADLNSSQGLVAYKGLSPDEALEVTEQRRDLVAARDGGIGDGGKLVASTVLVRSPDFRPKDMDQRSVAVPPDRFGELAEGAIRSLERLMGRKAISHDRGRQVPHNSLETPNQAGRVELRLEDLSPELQADVEKARQLAGSSAFPAGKRTKVGAVLRAGEATYGGTNIKRRAWNDTTCAERMAVDRALGEGVQKIDSLVVCVDDGSGRAAAPCAECRGIIMEAAVSLGQEDLAIYLVTTTDSRDAGIVYKTSVSELLPMSFETRKASL